MTYRGLVHAPLREVVVFTRVIFDISSRKAAGRSRTFPEYCLFSGSVLLVVLIEVL